ncbi:MAG: four helix bundle protein [Candidatus Bipolaricaulota bacterium]|nr:four helix bundle protein [Candidatus Bipolaricaulota bacterium]
MKIERFGNIEAWKATRELTKSVYKLTSDGQFNKDYGLRDQIQRASVSIMANISEGFDSQTNKAFIQFLGYALRSATEVQSHPCVALDQRYITSTGIPLMDLPRGIPLRSFHGVNPLPSRY